MKRLTDVRYWDQEWWTRERPRRLRLYRDFDFETVRFLQKAIRSTSYDRAKSPSVLEIGAGGSRVLPYLARHSGCRVFGSDFSFNGCVLLRENLALQNVAGGVVCEDVFQSALRPETFDVVYSSGLVEHFDEARAVIAEHLRFVKPGGWLVVAVPNLRGLQGRIFQKLAPPLWETHQIFAPEDIADHLKSLGLLKICRGYLGSFFIHIGREPKWSVVMSWPVWFQFLLHGSVRLVNGLISLLFRLSPLRPHSRLFSPAAFAAGIKPRT